MKERRRKSAKSEIETLVNDILTRTNDPHAQVKLNLLQTIAGRMGWNDLFEKLKRRYAFTPITETAEKPEPWWTR